jgi:hypothetical protein
MNIRGPQLLDRLSIAVSEFRRSYKRVIGRIRETGLSFGVCTIYNGNLEKSVALGARAALAVFNDAIYSAAAESDIPVIELRRVCTDESDYANPIEPSGAGGRKIARAILQHVQRYSKEGSG